MSRKININGKEYPKKYIFQIGFAHGRCLLRQHKEAYLFDCGIAIFKMEEGGCKRITTDNVDGIFSMMFYDTCGPDDEILFADESIKGWNAMFVYMFNEYEAFLLYATKESLCTVGARAQFVGEASYPSIRREAFTLASLFQASLVDKLLSMEKDLKERDSDKTLLDTEVEDGEA